MKIFGLRSFHDNNHDSWVSLRTNQIFKCVLALGNNVYRRSDVPNEPSISQRSFRRMFEKKGVRGNVRERQTNARIVGILRGDEKKRIESDRQLDSN